MWNRLAAPMRVALTGLALVARSVLDQRSLVLLLGLAVAGPAAADIFDGVFTPTAPSVVIETSIRAAGMGGASSAVTWGEPGVWANPATLSGVSGIGWVTGHTNIAPDLIDGLEFSSQRVLIGGGGLGFSFMGQPISGLGKAQFEVGSSLIGGGGFKPFDRTQGWGVGVSPLKLIDAVKKLSGNNSGSLTSYGDVAFGYQSKESEIHVSDADAFTFQEAPTYDWGVVGRLALSRWWGADAPFRLSLSGAYSQANVLKGDNENSSETTQMDRTGVALHLSPAPPSARSASPPSLPWWRPGDVPELSVGLAYDHERRHVEPFDSDGSILDHFGFEANVFRLLALRVGYLSDPDGEIEGWSYGGGLTVPIGPWGSVGWQAASVPVAEGLDRQFRQGWSVWVDPTRFWTASR